MKQYNAFSIGIRNLTHQTARTVIMSAFVVVLTAVLLASGVMSESISQSIRKTVGRMGADLIVVPSQYSSAYSDSLFRGEHCSFYFDRSLLDRISATDGVAAVTPQLYIATLEESCCSAPIQLIAFEPESDFIVTPWLQGMQLDELDDYQILVGGSFAGDIGESIYFFNVPLTIAGRLERTGTGYDTCAFITFATAQKMMQTDKMRDIAIGDRDPETLVSSVMVRMNDGVNARSLAIKINRSVKDSDLKAYTPDGIMSSIAKTVSGFQSFSTVLNILMAMLAIPAIICIFTITIIQRKNEFGVLMTLGASNAVMIKIILTEGLMIGLIGSLVGMSLAGGVIASFQAKILTAFSLPALVSAPSFYVTLICKCIAIALLIGTAASVCAILRVCRRQPVDLIREINA